jgi:MoaA/NifB/PqqE/SkfB family radical SAM enzyme
MSQRLSIDDWYHHVIEKNDRADEILKLLRGETPARLSVIFERACNLQCNHCIFQNEKSSKKLSQRHNLKDIVVAFADQLPESSPEGNPPLLIHEGRILTPWHVDILSDLRDVRSDVNIFLIDNGKTLTACKNKLDKKNFTFDTIDISIDGTESTHNQQRDDGDAFANARDGIAFAKEVSNEVTSLFTITSINNNVIKATGNKLLGDDLVNSWHVTGMSPARPEIAPHAATENEWAVAWGQIRDVYHRFPQRTHVHVYNHSDLGMIANAAEQTINQAVSCGNFGVEHGQIMFQIDGVQVMYSPLSIWPQETFLIDSDATCRVAYSLALTLDELRSGTDRFGDSCSQYTVKQLQENDVLAAVYQRCVDQWWQFKGRKYLKEEKQLFDQLLS